MTTTFDQLAERILAGGAATPDDALAVLRAHDEELLDVVAAAGRLRRAHFGNTVKVNYLVNLKSGLCQENCNYCSQALGSTAPILKYSWLKTDEALEQAAAGLKGGATRVCMVSSGRGPSDRDIDKVTEMVGAIKGENPGVEVCACLGLLKDGQAERLKDAGVDAYNHNINTAESHHDKIVQTHTYADRVDTVTKAKGAGLSPCSGLIAGLGETDEQLVEALFALRELESDSIPVNFLMPFDGTPYENTWELDPAPLPEDPRDGALRVPRQGGPDRRRSRDAPALPAGARAARRQLDLPRRLPHLRGPGRRDRPRADPRQRLRGARQRRARRAGRRRHSHDPAIRRRGAGTAVARPTPDVAW